MEIIKNHRLFLLMESFLWLLFGSLAIALPIVMTTLNVPSFLGILFLILGAWQILRCIVWRHRVQGWVPTLVNLVSYFVFGSMLIGMTFETAISPTIIITVLFAFDGITKVVIGTTWWFLYSGIITLCFSFSIWVVQTQPEIWVTSVFVGTSMLIFGIALIGAVIFSGFNKKIQ